ncbi:MAG: ribose-5-phosphate isomerase [Acidobacteria bacterium]|nr:MAG: ribose-5-phosphate isomerase [Acidobacteriota bacterium]
MRIALGADHAGYELKDTLAGDLRARGHEVIDLGTDGPAPVDYPDFAEAVGLAIRDGRAARGILVCGSGVGASVAANKIPGIRAVLGARVIGVELARDLVRAFLEARFGAEARHRRRLRKVAALERRAGGAAGAGEAKR